MDYGRPDLADRLAAEYVAGTLRGPARRRLEALLPAHPALRQAVVRWQTRLMPMTQVVEPVEPPAHVWRAIEARLGFAAAAAPRPLAALRWWQQLGVWRGLSAAASAAALVLAVLLARPPEAAAPIVVVLQSTSGPQQGQGGFVAAVGADGRGYVTRPIMPISLPAGRVLELWAVPPQGAGAPTSLGLIARDAASVVPAARLPAGTAALAVSEEPPGGSPTGTPTGPVLWAGQI